MSLDLGDITQISQVIAEVLKPLQDQLDRQLTQIKNLQEFNRSLSNRLGRLDKQQRDHHQSMY